MTFAGSILYTRIKKRLQSEYHSKSILLNPKKKEKVEWKMEENGENIEKKKKVNWREMENARE